MSEGSLEGRSEEAYTFSPDGRTFGNSGFRDGKIVAETNSRWPWLGYLAYAFNAIGRAVESFAGPDSGSLFCSSRNMEWNRRVVIMSIAWKRT
jgi:hypothetical protein